MLHSSRNSWNSVFSQKSQIIVADCSTMGNSIFGNDAVELRRIEADREVRLRELDVREKEIAQKAQESDNIKTIELRKAEVDTDGFKFVADVTGVKNVALQATLGTITFATLGYALEHARRALNLKLYMKEKDALMKTQYAKRAGFEGVSDLDLIVTREFRKLARSSLYLFSIPGAITVLLIGRVAYFQFKKTTGKK